jgi:hypothetical protein
MGNAERTDQIIQLIPNLEIAFRRLENLNLSNEKFEIFLLVGTQKMFLKNKN